MATKKVSNEQIRNVLGVGLFENKREIRDTDPIEPISMRLPIDQVEPYDRNPRRVRNPEYDSILESLRANGQDEALTITRRPGSEKYMIKRGGNTRLEIMKMLYHEAGDERFAEIDCLYKPWTGEADCILGHITENSTQGAMTLIDKARGYREFKIEYEREHGIENLGLRKLAALLKEKGASISPSVLVTMNYALDILEPAIPETLNRGLGKPQIEKLRRLHQTFERLAEAHDLFDPANREAQVRAEFHRLLSDHDGDEWDMELVIHEFTQRLGELLEGRVLYNRLVFDIEQCLQRDPWKVELMTLAPEDAPETGGSASDTQQQPGQQSLLNESSESSTDAGNTPAARQTEPQGQRGAAVGDSTPQSSKRAPTPPTGPEAPPPDSAPATAPASTGENTLPTALLRELPESSILAGEFDIKSHRARIYTLALQFAKLNRIPTCILPWSAGYGFFLDMPKTVLPSPRDPNIPPPEGDYQLLAWRLSKDRDEVAKAFAWWLLWIAVGVYDYRTESLLPGAKLMPECRMRDRLFSIYSMHPGFPEDRTPLMFNETTAMSRAAGEINSPMDLGLATAYIRPEHMMRYLELMEARTQLQLIAEEQGIDLWEAQS